VRRTRLYCVGTAKSGTHSITDLFAGTRLRAAHEPSSRELIQKVFAAADGEMTESEMHRYLLSRDERLSLDVDSSQLNYFILPSLLSLFDQARFILTIRDVYSWLNSFINHQLSRKASVEWLRLRDFRFGSHPAEPEDQPLIARGLYPLNGYLSYWSRHNRSVIRDVPPERLLIVRTDRLSVSVKALFEFAGLPADDAPPEAPHAYKAAAEHEVVHRLDPAYLERSVQAQCADLMAAFFPEIRSRAEAFGS